MDPQLLGQLRQTVYVAAPTGTSGTGDLAYGAPAARAARVELARKLVDSPDGSQRVTTHRVILAAAIGDQDRLWLPGDDSTDAAAARMPAAVSTHVDELGAVDHCEVLV